MSMGNIKSDALRRFVLVITAPLLVPVALLGIAGEAVMRALPEIATCFCEVWRARK